MLVVYLLPIIILTVFITLLVLYKTNTSTSNIITSIKWVAVGDEGSSEPGYIISYDGLNWIRKTSPGYDIGYGIGYNGSNLLVSVGGVLSGSNTLYSSTDAQTWSLGTDKSFNDNINSGGAVVYGENTVVANRWVAGSKNDNNFNLLTSLDGLSWTSVTTGTNLLSEVLSIDYTTFAEEPVWVAGGVGDNSLIFSSDGVSWNVTTGAQPTIDITAVKSGPSAGNPASKFWVAVGEGNTYYSVDGEAWTLNPDFTYPGGGSIRSLDYGNGLWSFCGNVGIDPIYYSTDGISWDNALVDIPDVDAITISYGHSLWVLGTSPQLYHSTDGYTYTVATGDVIGVNANSIKAINL